MKKIYTIILFLAFGTLCFSLNYFSPVNKYLFIEKTDTKTKYHLKNHIIINSVKIYIGSKKLNPESDYKIDYQNNILIFTKEFKNVKIEYMILPDEFTKKFQNFVQTEISDTLLNKIKISKKRYSSTANLNISGSKTISFTLSNNSDIDFDQTLFLKVNGELYKNMYIESQLSDNQLPITPEGNSKELSNIDKIFIRIYGKQYEIKFGDLEMNFDNTQFFNYHPIFEGVKAKWFEKNYYEAAAALSKGKKGEANFYGVESKQGPYYLSSGYDTGIKIVPGSEEIYLNGILMQRGQDYTIDYSEGSITFTDSHFISSSSYISAYFLYSDENYKQNLYITKNQIKIGDNIGVYNYFIWEKDDKSNPLQQNFSKEDLEILKNAGDNIAWGNGVQIATDGKGQYKFSEDDNYYIYAPDDTTAIYNITFTYVGSGNGSYTISENGEYYIYAGENEGDYIPNIKLIPPQNNLNYDIKTTYTKDFFRLNAETILTYHDKNSFSNLDDNDNFSNAIYLSTTLNPDFDKIKPILQFELLKKKKNLYTFAGLDKEDQNIHYTALPDSFESLKKDIKFSFAPFKLFELKTKYSSDKLKNYADVNVFKAELKRNEAVFIPFINISLRKQLQKNYQENTANKEYKKYRIDTYKTLSQFKIGLSGYSENYKSNTEGYDFGFHENSANTYFSVQNKSAALKLLYETTQKDTLNNNYYEKNKYRHTFGLETKLKFKNSFLNGKIYHRIITLPEKKSYDLANINLRSSAFDNGLVINSAYKIDNLEFFPKIRQLVKVSYGLYDSTGVLGGEGGYDWIIKYIDYEHPQKSIEVNLTTDATINPKILFGKFPLNSRFETYLQLYENSTSHQKKKVYLFYPSYFFNEDSSVLSKKIIRQTLWSEIIKNKLRVRFDYKIDNTLDQRYQKSALNKSDIFSQEITYKYSLPLSFKVYYEKENRTESIYQSDFNDNKIETGFFYRANSSLMFGSTIGYAIEKAQSVLSTENYFMKNIYSQHNITLFLHRKYRIFSKFKIEKVFKNSEFLNNYNEKTAGFHFKIDINLNYRLNRYTSSTLKYSGNLYQNAKDEHKLALEIKAEF